MIKAINSVLDGLAGMVAKSFCNKPIQLGDNERSEMRRYISEMTDISFPSKVVICGIDADGRSHRLDVIV